MRSLDARALLLLPWAPRNVETCVDLDVLSHRRRVSMVFVSTVSEEREAALGACEMISTVVNLIAAFPVKWLPRKKSV